MKHRLESRPEEGAHSVSGDRILESTLNHGWAQPLQPSMDTTRLFLTRHTPATPRGCSTNPSCCSDPHRFKEQQK